MTKSMLFANHRVVGTVLVAVLWSAIVQHASMQTPPTAAWAGWARCQVDVQGPGYTEHQTHTWTIAGGTPTVEGAFRVYPGTWSVVGGGTLQRTQGTQTLNAQWAINVPSMSAPIAVFVRADGRMFIQARHAQLRSSGAVAGYQQQTIDGKPQPPAQISAEAFEWAFPVIDGASTSTSVSGSSAPGVNGSVGYMQAAGSRGTASCTWQFGQGAAAPAPPPSLAAQAIPTPSSTGGNAAGAVPAGSGGAGGAGAATSTTTPPQLTATSPNQTAGATITPTTTTTSTTTALPPVGTFGNLTGTKTLTPASGTYLVTVTGLICGQATGDSPFDGRGDEIYAAAYVRRYDRRSFNILDSTILQTYVYGDTNNAPDRIQAGTKSALGGIQTGDKIPGDMSVARVVPAQDSRFPWKLWQGTLTDGIDALVISPTIWEYDGSETVLAAWGANQTSLNDKIFLSADIQNQIKGLRFSPVVLSDASIGVSGGIVSGANQALIDTTFTALTGLPNAQFLLGGNYDRPLGLTGDSFDMSVLKNRVVVLTREIIELALKGPSPIVFNTPTPGISVLFPKPGIMVIGFIDGKFSSTWSTLDSRGAYYMVLQVERVGSTSATSDIDDAVQKAADAAAAAAAAVQGQTGR